MATNVNRELQKAEISHKFHLHKFHLSIDIGKIRRKESLHNYRVKKKVTNLTDPYS